MRFETDLTRRDTPSHRALRAACALSLALTLAGAAGCSDAATDPAAGTDGVTGTYVLREVAGHTLPATIHDGPYTFGDGTTVERLRVVVTGAAYVLLPDGAVLELFDVVRDADGAMDTLRLSGRGTYRLRADSITIEGVDCACRESGTVNGGTLRVMADAMGNGTRLEYVYRK